MTQPSLIPPAAERPSPKPPAGRQLVSNRSNDALSNVSTDLINPEEIEAKFAYIQSELKNYDTAQLVQLAKSAEALERCAFKLRGMIAHELQCRIAKRLSGGRGNRDRERIGIKSKMYDLAERANVSYSTLANDARIYRTFFADAVESKLAGEPTLPRDFYLTALGLAALGEEKPREAIRMAAQRVAAGGYTREEFREYVRRLAEPKSPNENGEPADKRFVRERVTHEVEDALAEIVRATNKTRAEVIEAAILDKHRALKRRAAEKASPNNGGEERVNVRVEETQ